ALVAPRRAARERAGPVRVASQTRPAVPVREHRAAVPAVAREDAVGDAAAGSAELEPPAALRAEAARRVPRAHVAARVGARGFGRAAGGGGGHDAVITSAMRSVSPDMV